MSVAGESVNRAQQMRQKVQQLNEAAERATDPQERQKLQEQARRLQEQAERQGQTPGGARPQGTRGQEKFPRK